MSSYVDSSTDQEVIVPTQRDENILRSLLQLLHDVIPLVHRIRHNLQETSQRVPDVSRQLNNVTQATETATVEILNVLEVMAGSITVAQTSLAELKKKEDVRSALLVKMGEQFPDLVRSESWKEYLSSQNNQPTIEQIDQALTQTNDSSLSIAMALQVQDITSQQIAGANHLIEQVEGQLRTALVYFETVENDPINAGKEAESSTASTRPVTFDHTATYTKSGDRQEEADKITQQFLRF